MFELRRPLIAASRVASKAIFDPTINCAYTLNIDQVVTIAILSANCLTKTVSVKNPDTVIWLFDVGCNCAAHREARHWYMSNDIDSRRFGCNRYLVVFAIAGYAFVSRQQ